MGRLDILKNSNNKIVQEDVYKSEFNFKEFEIEDQKIIEEISKKEEEIIKVGRQIARKTLELGEMLYGIQNTLADHKSGSFVAWFTYMGLNKNFVYREINRWELFQRYKNPQIAEASIRTLEFIKKNKELEENKIIEILEKPEKASEVIKEIKEETEEKEKTDKFYEINKIEEKIEKLKEKIQKLESKKEKIMRKEI